MAFIPALIRLNGMIAGSRSSMTFSIGAPRNSGVNIRLQNTMTIVIAAAPQTSAAQAAVLVRVR